MMAFNVLDEYRSSRWKDEITPHTSILNLSAHLNAPWEAVFDTKNKYNEKTNAW